MRKTNSLLAVTFSAASILGVSSNAFANPQFYAGLQAGYQGSSLERTHKYRSDDYSYNYQVDGYAIDGIAGGLFAGVKFEIGENAFIGLEANVGTGNAETSEKEREADLYEVEYKSEAKTSYGIAALAGLKITPSTSLYGRLGYQRTKYEHSLRAFIPGDGEYSLSESDTYGGFRVGIGMETALTEHLAVRVDWSQTHYSSKSIRLTEQDVVDFEPVETLFQVGVSYNF